jgi:hypothetical protein
MEVVEIFEDFWYRAKWFIKEDCKKYLMWAGVICIAGIIIPYFRLKEIYEKRKKKGGVR